MRILHAVRQFWPASGGLENFVLNLATEQLRNGTHAEVLTLNRVHSHPGAILPAENEVRGIRVHRIGYLGSPRYPLAFGATRGLQEFDLIHVHGVDFFCDYLAATKPIHRKPLVLSTHGDFFHTPRNKRLKDIYFNVVTRRSLKRFHLVLASSVNDEQIFRPIVGDRLRHIDNGVDTNKFAAAASGRFRPSLIYFGRFSSSKGLHLLLSTFAVIKEQFPDACLHLAGNDYDGILEGLKAQIAATINDGSVHIRTGLDDEGLRAVINGCSFFVSASQYEGFGVSLVEAMSAGLIPIVNRIPSFEAIIENSSDGTAIDFSHPRSAGAEIVRYLKRVQNNYEGMRLAVMEASQPYSWKRVSKVFEACYSEVLGVRERRILGVKFAVLNRRQAIEAVKGALNSDKPLKVAFANANTLNLAVNDAAYRLILNKFLVLNDGIGVDLASRMKFGSAFPDNLNGTDFVPGFLSTVGKPLRIYLIGSSTEAARQASARLAESWPNHRVVGWRNGFFHGQHEIDEACRAIRAASADILLVGMGNPKQELWIAHNADTTGAKLAIGVGALVDFLAGKVLRAPRCIRNARCEWIFRLALEPRRLARRYLIGNLLFLLRAFRDRYNLRLQ